MDRDLFKAVSAHLLSREARLSAWIIWFVLLLTVIFISIFGVRKRTVLPAYTRGSQLWCEGRDLYGQGIQGYLYLPRAATLVVPFSFLPAWVQESGRRCFTVVTLAWASMCFAPFGQRLWEREHPGGFGLNPLAMFPAMTVLIVPLSIAVGQKRSDEPSLGGLDGAFSSGRCG